MELHKMMATDSHGHAGGLLTLFAQQKTASELTFLSDLFNGQYVIEC